MSALPPAASALTSAANGGKALGHAGGLAWDLAQTILAVGVVCAIAYLVLRFGVRRLHGGQAQGPLRVLARLPLEPRRGVYLIEARSRVFLVGSAENGLTLLAEVSEPADTAAPAKPESP
ncbi:MAG: flagellar biosynthetic protein FliO [Myxococcota bacterium]